MTEDKEQAKSTYNEVTEENNEDKNEKKQVSNTLRKPRSPLKTLTQT